MIMVQTFRVPVILLYHSVRYTAGGSIYRISITPERFQRHVSFLTSNFRVVPLQEFVDALASRTRIEGMACITFDDGYVDNLEAARDILCKYRTSATIFIPTGFVGRPYFWWDALHAISTAASRQPDKARVEMQAQFPALREAVGITEAEWFNVWDRMRRHPLDDAYAAVGELAARLDVNLKDLPRPVTSRELKEFAKWPFEIGSHAESHRPLPSLSIEEVRSELQASRAFLESSTGRSVRSFSYPFGLFDHEVAQACQSLGYSCAVSLVRDHRISYSDVFDLPRIDGADGDVDELTSELDRIEQGNARAFAVHSMTPPRPIEARPEKCHTDTQALVGPAPPSAFRGGDLFRVTPINRDWGWGHGIPLDRPFIDRFIQTHRGDLYGRILEVKEPEYTSRYARPGSQIDILDIDRANKAATIVDDLQSCAQIEDNTYDCLILTQVLQLVPDFQSAIATAARILRPGGILLLTVCGITQGVSSNEGSFSWSFFQPGLKHALSTHFDTKKLLLHSHGNVGLAASFLMGLTTADVPPDLLLFEDREYPIVVTARALKPFAVPTVLSWPLASDEPEISVIIPMFNAATTIKEALFSVSQQDHASYEILIVDDGSTDESRRIVDQLARNSNGRITVLEHAGGANRGLSLSRNLAMTHARGEFVIFLDADDTIHPSKFIHDVNILRTHPEAAAVIGRALWWWDGNGNQDAHLDTILEPLDRIVYPPEFFSANYQMMTAGSPPCIHSWMVRKSAMDQIEPFDPHMMTYEDQKFLGELSLRFPIYVASTCLCDYRRKEGTLWSTALASGSDSVAYSRFLEWKAGAIKISSAYSREQTDGRTAL
jgi:peptidoglycan/xylan/chitin deacetylase (PgdA/CDA1 family)/SAM-dependent methyltransferase